MRSLVLITLLAAAGVSTGYGVRKAYACSCIDFYGEKSALTFKDIAFSQDPGKPLPEGFDQLAEQFKKLNHVIARGGANADLHLTEKKSEDQEDDEEDALYLNFEIKTEGSAQ